VSMAYHSRAPRFKKKTLIPMPSALLSLFLSSICPSFSFARTSFARSSNRSFVESLVRSFGRSFVPSVPCIPTPSVRPSVLGEDIVAVLTMLLAVVHSGGASAAAVLVLLGSFTP
jgi:hypothetical protein